ncbi:DUF2231 domain-containing protein [Qipengyuania nanhaisediminis]|uniref:Uncharacterized membrane protein n=1 Tax=Qipengyuania nanhaisediminis TaxID=604088 RepID=A0A1I5MF34_9SPHN|nr:DUF2231 domain-containing protein [Qipengyuania nanhaisediminis]SFP08195.1 Uncharacterized membrane protein [Qipengyuania nanhaisediminis]
MKPIQFMAIVAASLLSISPAQAHGDEEHGEAASAVVSDAASEDIQSAQGHGDTAADHDGANGQDAGEGDKGVVGVLKSLHPATVHFPIALFFMAALTELFIIARKGTGLEPAVRVLVYGGAAGAVVAALFGWIHTGLWFGGDTAMQVHRWNGMLIAVLGLAMAYLASRASASRTLLRAAIFSMAALVLVQGFLGGELAHGANHLGISWL